MAQSNCNCVSAYPCMQNTLRENFFSSRAWGVAAVQLGWSSGGPSHPLPKDPGASRDLRRFLEAFYPPQQLLFQYDADVNNYRAKSLMTGRKRWRIKRVSFSEFFAIIDAQQNTFWWSERDAKSNACKSPRHSNLPDYKIRLT